MGDTRLQLVVGKGGVGKSTVAAALALERAACGGRVLALELGGSGGLARAFGVESSSEPVRTSQTAPPGEVYVASVDGEAALSEYLALRVPVRRLLRGVTASRFYKAFVGAAPGLKELMAVGKVWYECQKTNDDGSPTWSTVIVEAGATGHSLKYLRMPEVAAHTFASGLVHREADRVGDMLRDPDYCRVHVVALPEQMPLSEAREILVALDEELGMAVGSLIVNRCRQAAPMGAERLPGELTAASTSSAAGITASSLAAPLAELAARELSWLAIQESGLERIERDSGLRVFRLPLLAVEEFGLAELSVLVRVMGGVRSGEVSP